MFKGYKFIMLPSLIPTPTKLKSSPKKENTTQFDTLHSKIAKLEGVLERNLHPNFIINDKYFKSDSNDHQELVILVNLKILENTASIIPFFQLQKVFESKYIHEDPELFKLKYIDKIKDKLTIVDIVWFHQCLSQNLLINLTPYKIDISSPLDDEVFDIINSKTVKRRKLQKKMKSENPDNEHEIITDSKDSIRNYLNNIHHFRLHDNPNLKVIKILSSIRDEYLEIGDDFRVKAYNSAINSLMSTKEFINDSKKAKTLSGIGNKISLKIDEFYQTGTMKTLEELKNSNKLLKQLNKVYGFASKTSEYYIKEYSLKDFDDFKKKVESKQIQLTEAQSLGLKYYDDWNKKIYREKIDLHASFLNSFIEDNFKGLQMFVMGSYRRNLTYSNDIDLVLTQETLKTEKELEDSKISEKFIQKLEDLKYIKCILSGNTKILTGVKLIKYKGLFKNEDEESVSSEFKICRRMDFLFVPYNELGATMLYFTGNNTFNRLFRQVAGHENMILNNHGLFRKDNSQLIESFDEKKIFDILKIKYLTPEQRNIGEYKRLSPSQKDS